MYYGPHVVVKRQVLEDSFLHEGPEFEFTSSDLETNTLQK